MPDTNVKIKASEGGEFDCYLATPAGGEPAPAVVLACSIDGVDADLRQIADEFAAAGFIAAGTGWPLFFALSALVAIPSLILLIWLQARGHFETLGKPKITTADD